MAAARAPTGTPGRPGTLGELAGRPGRWLGIPQKRTRTSQAEGCGLVHESRGAGRSRVNAMAIDFTLTAAAWPAGAAPHRTRWPGLEPEAKTATLRGR